jgi:O-ureido-D-serine cyclo-ligase
VALVTAREALTLDEDLAPLVRAFTSSGAQAEARIWDDPDVDWTLYDAAVLRSTWDYVDRIGEFLSWCERAANATHLVNSPALVRWNTDKHYLRDLATGGVPVVPTRFVEPGQDAHLELERFLAEGSAREGACLAAEYDEIVVKPAIGAGSRDAARYGRAELERAEVHIGRLIAAGRSVLLQPYLGRVDEHGETALVYFGGVFSHAVRKGALLQRGAALVEGLFAPEEITSLDVDTRELAVGSQAVAGVGPIPPAYARVDLIRDATGEPVVLELELTEPSLFFRHAPGSAERFAAVLLSAIGKMVRGTT